MYANPFASFQALQNWWLSVWSEATAAAEASPQATSLDTHWYMGLYFAFGLSSLVFQVPMLTHQHLK